MDECVEKRKHNTVCAVVVTYNRKELLLESLGNLCEQTHPLTAICIVDNASTDNTSQALLDAGYIDELPSQEVSELLEKTITIKNDTTKRSLTVHYFRMNENTGGSGGFHEGIKQAYCKGYDWVWVMDDDGKAAPSCLEELLKLGEKGFYYVAPDIINHEGESFFASIWSNTRISNIGFKGGPFSAILLNKFLIEKVGYPMKNFFIWGDENEYTDRISECGFPMVTVRSARYFHKSTNVDYKTCKRGFYMVRNTIFRIRLFRGVFFRKRIFMAMGIYQCFKYLIRLTVKLNVGQIFTSIHGIVKGFTEPLSQHQEECKWWGIKDDIS